MSLIKFKNCHFHSQNVNGEVVLITGAGGGVGKYIALNFARLKAKVVIWDVNREGKSGFFILLLSCKIKLITVKFL
jgi:NAD(P)-dependent dehydrogenase (short-subunit alcohol dehydrogenase family)